MNKEKNMTETERKITLKGLKDLLAELDEQAQELIDCGNSKEKAEGYGMKTVTKAIYEYCKNTRSREFASTERIYDEQVKYIPESHHNEIVSELKKEIDRLKAIAEPQRKHWNTH